MAQPVRDLRSSPRRWLLVVMALALAMSGYATSSASPSDVLSPASLAGAGSTGSSTPDDSSVAEDDEEPAFDPSTIVERLAIAGIGVYDETGGSAPLIAPTEPISPMRLLSSHAAQLAHRAADLVGVSAVDLDAMIPPEVVAAQDVEGGFEVRASKTVAGWAQGAETPGAQLAEDILGDMATFADTAVFPDLVLLLFVSDLAIAGSMMGSEPESTVPGFAPTAAGDRGRDESAENPAIDAEAIVEAPCSTVVNFVSNTIANVFNALRGWLRPPAANTGVPFVDAIVTTLIGVVVNGVTVVLDEVQLVLENGIKVLLEPIMQVIGEIAGVLAVVGEVVSVIQPWSATMSATPPTNDLGIDPGPGNPGAIVLQVRGDLPGAEGQDWPAWLSDCARTAGVPLPSLTPNGHPVQWQPDPSAGTYIELGTIEPTLTARGTSTLTYTTRIEPASAVSELRVAAIGMRVTVTRDDTTELQATIAGLVKQAFASLIPPIGGLVGELAWQQLQPIAKRAFDVLESVRQETARGTLFVRYHEPRQATYDYAATVTFAAGDTSSFVGAVERYVSTITLTCDAAQACTAHDQSPGEFLDFTINGTVWTAPFTNQNECTRDGVTAFRQGQGQHQLTADRDAGLPQRLTGTAVGTYFAAGNCGASEVHWDVSYTRTS